MLGEFMSGSSPRAGTTVARGRRHAGRQSSRPYWAALLACASMLGACKQPPKPIDTAVRVSIIPAPTSVERGEGVFSITQDTRVTFGDGAEGRRIADYFIDLASRTHGANLRGELNDSPRDNAIHFELVPVSEASGSASGAEGYSLHASPKRIVVSASDSRGLLYGAVTLWQLLAKSGDGFVVPSVTIEDAPRFAWRGLMLDSARHFQPPEFIRKFIDLMALHKLNVLHWHLTDDQAWRLEIKMYPRLTEVGAWRVPAGPAAAADFDPATNKPRLYGGFYTQEDVHQIVAYAAARNITIVPEIDLPGHASAAIAAYPELGSDPANVLKVPADWGVYPNLFNVDESTFRFFEGVLEEVLAMFPGQYIHVGGDEAVKDQWKGSASVQDRMRELRVKDENQLQSYFIQRMEKFLASKGRRLIGWDEILEGGLPANATVMSWRGIDGALAAAKAGHDAVLSPQPVLYFDRRPLDTARPPGRGQLSTIKDVYNFEPMPPELKEDQRKHILGLQANIFTEHIRTTDRVEYMTFPRAAALAEVAWSSRKSWPDFMMNLPAQYGRYDALKVRYARNRPRPPMEPNIRTSHQMELCSDKVALSLEDDAPVDGERAVFMVDILDPCWIYKQADLSQVKSITASVGQVPFNFQVGDEVKGIPVRKPATASGELEVRLDDCEGPRIAVLSLAPAVPYLTVTTLQPAPIQPVAGKHDLCFTFTQPGVDPTWVIDSIELNGASGGVQGSAR